MKDFENAFHPRRPLKDYEIMEEDEEIEEPYSEGDDEDS